MILILGSIHQRATRGRDGISMLLGMAVVKVVEPTGSETHLVAEAQGRELVAVSRDRLALRPGDRIRLNPEGGRMHLFDAGTGKRIN